MGARDKQSKHHKENSLARRYSKTSMPATACPPSVNAVASPAHHDSSSSTRVW